MQLFFALIWFKTNNGCYFKTFTINCESIKVSKIIVLNNIKIKQVKNMLVQIIKMIIIKNTNNGHIIKMMMIKYTKIITKFKTILIYGMTCNCAKICWWSM